MCLIVSSEHAILERMGAGVESVAGYLAAEFGGTVRRSTNPESFATALSVQAQGRTFVVTVSTEVDENCDSGAIDVADMIETQDLAGKLRASKTARAWVRTTGVAAS
jgi:hypothetical protein